MSPAATRSYIPESGAAKGKYAIPAERLGNEVYPQHLALSRRKKENAELVRVIGPALLVPVLLVSIVYRFKILGVTSLHGLVDSGNVASKAARPTQNLLRVQPSRDGRPCRSKCWTNPAICLKHY